MHAGTQLRDRTRGLWAYFGFREAQKQAWLNLLKQTVRLLQIDRRRPVDSAEAEAAENQQPRPSDADFLQRGRVDVLVFFEATRRYVYQHGKPLAFHSDKASIVASIKPRRPVATAIRSLGGHFSNSTMMAFWAHTMAAKGRIERAQLTMQDRLVKELRLDLILTVEAANAFIPAYVADYNERFGKVARDARCASTRSS